ncbi:protein associated with UVRAG as autophagy enhancer [Leptonychotes weddellii]|uniref:Protein associated with UVRAG as autophagy enhancer n=1 Tax=Leptonychotes weddellii TaxID=9713 RepID=A0A7F8RQ42_LEPWE|nr:protein associated with UVRAG as autophagy enhancer [Leptonychotes weddellii]
MVSQSTGRQDSPVDSWERDGNDPGDIDGSPSLLDTDQSPCHSDVRFMRHKASWINPQCEQQQLQDLPPRGPTRGYSGSHFGGNTASPLGPSPLSLGDSTVETSLSKDPADSAQGSGDKSGDLSFTSTEEQAVLLGHSPQMSLFTSSFPGPEADHALLQPSQLTASTDEGNSRREFTSFPSVPMLALVYSLSYWLPHEKKVMPFHFDQRPVHYKLKNAKERKSFLPRFRSIHYWLFSEDLLDCQHSGVAIIDGLQSPPQPSQLRRVQRKPSSPRLEPRWEWEAGGAEGGGLPAEVSCAPLPTPPPRPCALAEFVKRLRYCAYLGKYFCDCCHTYEETCIPARILTTWDFRKYYVSHFSRRLLDSLWHEPVFNLLSVGPGLYAKAKELDRARETREQLFHIKKMLKTCRFAESELKEFEQVPRHLTDELHLFSLEDLVRVKKRLLVPLLKDILKASLAHVASCELCQGKGFICEFCQSTAVIFPFQTETCRRCAGCRACFHKQCFQSSECPRCARITARRRLLQSLPSAAT